MGSKTDAEQERHSFKGMYVVQLSLCKKAGPWNTVWRHSAFSDKIGGGQETQANRSKKRVHKSAPRQHRSLSLFDEAAGGPSAV